METWQKIVLGVGGLLVVALVVWGMMSSEVNSSDDEGNPNASIIYYYGFSCPHCHDVQEFIEKEGIAYGENFAKKEVWRNSTNQQEMLERARECGLNEGDLGVPFLYADGQCFIGAPDVQEQLSSRF